MNKANIKQALSSLATVDLPEGDLAETADDTIRANGVLETNFSKRGVHLDVQLDPKQVVKAAEILDAEGLTLDAVTGVDWLKDGQFEVIYDYNYTGGELFRVVIRARIDRETPDIPTITEVFSGANWHERETWDLFGINFIGHPQLERFLLPDDCDFHPLRKDFRA